MVLIIATKNPHIAGTQIGASIANARRGIAIFQEIETHCRPNYCPAQKPNSITTYSPARCIKENANKYGDVCTRGCVPGYKLRYGKYYKTVNCDDNGRWWGGYSDCIDDDECSNSACDTNAICTNTVGSYSCRCNHGFTGDGHKCTDNDECAASNKCHQNAICVNTPGSYECKCKQGYMGDGINCVLPESFRGLQNSAILRENGNASYLLDLSTFLDPVLQSSARSRWLRCWRASKDGWNVRTAFHPMCDNKGPTVTLVRVQNYIFGGYSDASWDNTGKYAQSSKAFVFSLFNTKGYSPRKFPIVQDQDKAIYGHEYYGPTFGTGHDLYISNYATGGYYSVSTPKSYETPPGCTVSNKCSFYTGTVRNMLSDVEVFYEIDAECLKCAQGASCLKTQGSHVCRCNHGFTGDGYSCSDIDECLSVKCDPNAVCMNTPGSYSCKCKKGFTGDGATCFNLRGLDKSAILNGKYGGPKYIQSLSKFLDPVLQSKTKSRWVRCWSASSDGWDVTKTFHPQCDKKGPTVTIVLAHKYIFGGYVDISWESSGEYAVSTKAFLFSLYSRNRGYFPIKLPIVRNQHRAITKNSLYGPTFGQKTDLTINNHASTSGQNTFFVWSYKAPPGCSHGNHCSFYTGSPMFYPQDVEVFYEVTV